MREGVWKRSNTKICTMLGGILYVIRHITSHVLNISNLACSFPMMVWWGDKKHKFSLTCSKGHYNPPEISLNSLCIAIKCFHRTREIRKKKCQQNTTWSMKMFGYLIATMPFLFLGKPLLGRLYAHMVESKTKTIIKEEKRKNKNKNKNKWKIKIRRKR